MKVDLLQVRGPQHVPAQGGNYDQNPPGRADKTNNNTKYFQLFTPPGSPQGHRGDPDAHCHRDHDVHQVPSSTSWRPPRSQRNLLREYEASLFILHPSDEMGSNDEYLEREPQVAQQLGQQQGHHEQDKSYMQQEHLYQYGGIQSSLVVLPAAGGEVTSSTGWTGMLRNMASGTGEVDHNSSQTNCSPTNAQHHLPHYLGRPSNEYDSNAIEEEEIESKGDAATVLPVAGGAGTSGVGRTCVAGTMAPILVPVLYEKPQLVHRIPDRHHHGTDSALQDVLPGQFVEAAAIDTNNTAIDDVQDGSGDAHPILPLPAVDSAGATGEGGVNTNNHNNFDSNDDNELNSLSSIPVDVDYLPKKRAEQDTLDELIIKSNQLLAEAGLCGDLCSELCKDSDNDDANDILDSIDSKRAASFWGSCDVSSESESDYEDEEDYSTDGQRDVDHEMAHGPGGCGQDKAASVAAEVKRQVAASPKASMDASKSSLPEAEDTNYMDKFIHNELIS